MTYPHAGSLASYNYKVYAALLCNPAYEHIISKSMVSITLVRNIVTKLANPKLNKKFRAKYVVELAALLDEDTSKWVLDECSRLAKVTVSICSNLSLIVNPVPLRSDLRIVSIENSAWYSAVVVGDSTHFTSCLSSGYLSDREGNNSHKIPTTEEEWVTYSRYSSGGGCNREYLIHEVEAFKTGHLFYVVDGELAHESPDSQGPTLRVRCYKILTVSGKDSVIVVDRLYGDRNLAPSVLATIQRTYPGVPLYLSYSLFYKSPYISIGDHEDINEKHKLSKELKEVYSDRSIIFGVRSVQLQSPTLHSSSSVRVSGRQPYARRILVVNGEIHSVPSGNLSSPKKSYRSNADVTFMLRDGGGRTTKVMLPLYSYLFTITIGIGKYLGIKEITYSAEGITALGADYSEYEGIKFMCPDTGKKVVMRATDPNYFYKELIITRGTRKIELLNSLGKWIPYTNDSRVSCTNEAEVRALIKTNAFKRLTRKLVSARK